MEGIDLRERLGLASGPAREIHVWWASSEVEPWQLRALWRTLSADELERVRRLRFPRDRRRFIGRRGLLGAMLARYVGAQAHELRFAYSPFGKPALALEEGRPALDFNLSHSAGFVLLAVGACGGVGIDVVQIDAHFDYRSVARSFFSPQQIEELERLPPARAAREFFRLWSLGEAIGKARGDGLAVLGEPIAPAWATAESALMLGCTAAALDVGDAYAATLALCGRWEMRLEPWHERLDGWEARYRVGVENVVARHSVIRSPARSDTGCDS